MDHFEEYAYWSNGMQWDVPPHHVLNLDRKCIRTARAIFHWLGCVAVHVASSPMSWHECGATHSFALTDHYAVLRRAGLWPSVGRDHE